jgi:CRISPR-associated protein Cas2
MFVVICYDITDDRRRNKVGKILEGFGSRVQKSVFECDLQLKHFEKLKQKLARVLRDEDSVRYYYLCAACLAKVEVINGPPVTESQLYFAV